MDGVGHYCSDAGADRSRHVADELTATIQARDTSDKGAVAIRRRTKKMRRVNCACQNGEVIMKSVWIVAVFAFLALATTGCGSSADRAQKRAYEAQQNVSEERLKLVDQYKKCVKDAGDDAVKVEACDTYLKAAEALK